MTAEARFDLVILGSGSTAFAAALRAQELGRSVVMTESRTIGGTCVNRGCLPSKNLIAAAQAVHDARRPRYPGIRGAELEVDFRALVQQKDELVTAYRQKKYESLVGGSIQVRKGHARFVDPHTIEVAGERLHGGAILIATGSAPVRPAIEGLADVPYLTSDLLTSGEDSELEHLPRSMVIVGGGYVAIELGQMLRRFGTTVTIVERSEALLSHGYEPEVGPAVRAFLEEEGVEILTRARVRRVAAHAAGVQLDVDLEGSSRRLQAEQLLIATGRRPQTGSLLLERVGVNVGDHGEVLVDRYLRTSVSHVFGAGDVIGGEQGSQMATPVGSHDGGIAALNALAGGDLRAVDHRVIPRVIFSDPPVAVVGMTEAAALAAGHRCWCNALPLSLVPRAGAIRDTRGFVKLVANTDTHEVLGVTMVGSGSAEVIHEAAMALRFRATLLDFIDQLHVYPTMSEALKIAALSRFKDPARLSCCAE